MYRVKSKSFNNQIKNLVFKRGFHTTSPRRMPDDGGVSLVLAVNASMGLIPLVNVITLTVTLSIVIGIVVAGIAINELGSDVTEVAASVAAEIRPDLINTTVSDTESVMSTDSIVTPQDNDYIISTTPERLNQLADIIRTQTGYLSDIFERLISSLNNTLMELGIANYNFRFQDYPLIVYSSQLLGNIYETLQFIGRNLYALMRELGLSTSPELREIINEVISSTQVILDVINNFMYQIRPVWEQFRYIISNRPRPA
jgi:hypothetical protein